MPHTLVVMDRANHTSPWLRVMVALLSGLPGLAGATLALAQQPLLGAAGSMPKPNLMLTVDTSASMAYRHMPEWVANVNGKTLTVYPGGVNHVHPGEGKPSSPASAMPAYIGSEYLNPEVLREQVYARSPFVNTIYYDPRVRYRPWAAGVSDTGQTLRYASAVFTKAYIDPLKQGATDTAVDLSAAVSYEMNPLCPFDAPCHDQKTTRLQHPAIVYMLEPASADPTQIGHFKRYDIFSASATQNGPHFPGRSTYPGRTECAQDHCTSAQEQQNYANWFVYYRTRMLTTQAALSEAFHNMDDLLRVGWTTLRHAKYNRWTQNKIPIIEGVKDLTPEHRRHLVDTIQNTNDSGHFVSANTTELRVAMEQVGQYFSSAQAFSPWENTPAPLTSTEPASGQGSICRRSYNMLTTDGYYNDLIDEFKDVAWPGDVDSDQPSFENYTRTHPYQDRASGPGYANTLADFALKYWATDLSPLSDGVRPKGHDPATWQHLSQYTVGLGVSGTLQADKDTLARLANGTLAWPDPDKGNAQKIDDLWHAAINSRGAYYNVRTAADLERAVRTMVNDATGQSLREAGVTTAATALQSDNLKFVPEYDSGLWTGNLHAYRLNASGQLVSPDDDTVTDEARALWSAAELLPAAALRQVLTTADDGHSLIPFRWDAPDPNSGTESPSPSFAAAMGSIQPASPALVNYLRGDQSQEGSEDGQFRKRTSVLADIVNSTPVLAHDKLDMGYGTTDGYDQFRSDKAGRDDPLLFVGGNGGMLHAFSAATGVERFAFVPRGVLPHLYRLAEPGYAKNASAHRYFVDGPLTEADVQIDDAWQHLLIGSLGAGGKGLFALRLPLEGAEPSLLWDLTGGDGDTGASPTSVSASASIPASAYIGHILSRAEAGRLPNGQWVVVVGNGINSSIDRAALLVIDVASGAVSAIPVGPSADNGLTGVAVVRNANRDIVALYGGDLQGHLWRFEYSADDESLKVGHGGRPLFKAGTLDQVQPITAAPVVTRHDAHQMVLFGTGRLLTEADRQTTQVQAFYGVLDTVPAEQPSADLVPPGDAVVPRSALVTQTISSFTNSTNSTSPYTFLSVSNHPQTADSQGWALELIIPPVAGNDQVDTPRVIYEPVLTGDFVLITAISPSPDALECELAEGRAYDFLLPALTGAQYDKPVFDTSGDGEVTDVGDRNAAGVVTRAPGRRAILTGERDSGSGRRKLSIQHGQGGLGAADWRLRDASVILDRVWQRIQPPPDRTPPPTD